MKFNKLRFFQGLSVFLFLIIVLLFFFNNQDSQIDRHEQWRQEHTPGTAAYEKRLLRNYKDQQLYLQERANELQEEQNRIQNFQLMELQRLNNELVFESLDDYFEKERRKWHNYP